MKKFNLILFTIFTMLVQSMVAQDFNFECPNCPQIATVQYDVPNLPSSYTGYTLVGYEELTGINQGFLWNGKLNQGDYFCTHLLNFAIFEEMRKEIDAVVDYNLERLEAGSTTICAAIDFDYQDWKEDTKEDITHRVSETLLAHKYYSQFSESIAGILKGGQYQAFLESRFKVEIQPVLDACAELGS